MGIDPKKLEAFAQGGRKAGVKPPPPPVEDDMTDAAEEAKEGEGRFGKLLPLLEKFHEDVEAACDELDPEVLKDSGAEMPPEDQTILKDGFENLDGELVAAGNEELSGGISMDEAHGMANHLESEGMTEDPDRVAGWLFRLAQTLGGADDGGTPPPVPAPVTNA
jgi:hypothetical protein